MTYLGILVLSLFVFVSVALIFFVPIISFSDDLTARQAITVYIKAPLYWVYVSLTRKSRMETVALLLPKLPTNEWRLKYNSIGWCIDVYLGSEENPRLAIYDKMSNFDVITRVLLADDHSKKILIRQQNMKQPLLFTKGRR